LEGGVAFDFKVWDQARDGHTMAVRVSDINELRRLSRLGLGPDVGGSWTSLADYLSAAAAATVEPAPYVRWIDVLWDDPRVAVPSHYSQRRRFRVTYSGRVRTRGGFSSQAYLVVDPTWEPALRAHDGLALRVDYFVGDDRDLLVVRG
jgi:hypothetical protein